MAKDTKITKVSANAKDAKLVLPSDAKELEKILTEKNIELKIARQSLSQNTLQNVHITKKLRKDIARIKTKLNQERKDK